MFPIIDAIIHNKESEYVIVLLLTFFVITQKNESKKPLLSIIPIPINNIRSIDSGANDAKFDTALLNIYFIPLNVRSDSTDTRTVSSDPLAATFV